MSARNVVWFAGSAVAAALLIKANNAVAADPAALAHAEKTLAVWAIVTVAACSAGLLALAGWTRRGTHPGRIRAAFWLMYGAMERGRQWADGVDYAILGTRIRASLGTRNGSMFSVRGRDRAAVPAPAPGTMHGAVGAAAGTPLAAGPGAGTAHGGLGVAAGDPGGVLGTSRRQGTGGGVASDDADFEARARAFRAEMEQVNGRLPVERDVT